MEQKRRENLCKSSNCAWVNDSYKILTYLNLFYIDFFFFLNCITLQIWRFRFWSKFKLNKFHATKKQFSLFVLKKKTLLKNASIFESSVPAWLLLRCSDCISIMNLLHVNESLHALRIFWVVLPFFMHRIVRLDWT